MKKTYAKLIIFSLAIFLVDIVLIKKTGISITAIKAIDIMFLAIFLWMSEIVPATVTALIIFCLIPSFKIISTSDTFSVMGNIMIWRLAGIFIITIGIEQTGLGRRIAFKILSFARGNLYLLLFLMAILTFIFAFIIPAVSARTALLASICMGVIKKMDQKENANFAKACSIIIPIVSLVSGSSSMVGASQTIFSASFFERTLGYKWTYLTWLKTMLPVNILALFVIYIIIIKIFPFEAHMTENKNWLYDEDVRFDRVSANEKKMMVVVAFLLMTWFLNLSEELPAEFIASTILFLPGIGILNCKETLKKLQWGTLILFGSGLAMAESLNQTKAIDCLISSLYKQFFVQTEFFVVVAIVVVTVLVRLGMSNMTGVVAILLPIYTSIAKVLAINPLWMGMICVLACGLGILVPSQSSSHLATYVYGYYTAKDLFKVGILIVIAYVFIIYFFAVLYWPQIGLKFK